MAPKKMERGEAAGHVRITVGLVKHGGGAVMKLAKLFSQYPWTFDVRGNANCIPNP